ncbi:MAG: hypothetical protein E5X33_12130 [Mesorhizobium sp.]|uniref:hypothetical protein n=1 Tax=Mesorhizobium sp. TaxID=1871066 RepID=UPI00121C1E67|nr:hypothetical protein [Mesorhizobium sp.]TIR21806.1 MAG: hypothetical protein E5X33_12130 [Mesorhizobium sp.]
MNQNQLSADIVERLVNLANRAAPEIDETMASVRRVMAKGEVVFGVWQDKSQPFGVGVRCVKGHNRLREISQGTEAKLRIVAIPCVEEAQAVALEQIEGDRVN